MINNKSTLFRKFAARNRRKGKQMKCNTKEYAPLEPSRTPVACAPPETKVQKDNKDLVYN